MGQLIRFIQGDCRERLKDLPDQSVQSVVTSPPYFGLRDYGTSEWAGGWDPNCDHARSVVGGPKQTRGAGQQNGHASAANKLGRRECVKCGAVRTDSQIGLEPTPAAYVAELVGVFREVWRVLRDDGTVWLNLGDSYNNFRVSKGPGQAVHGRDKLNGKPAPDSGGRGHLGFKEKDLMMIPARVAIALCDDGWYLRQDNVWAKRNCMPESVQDRTTRAHEYVFMLTKRPNYFYDAKAIEEDGEIAAGTRAAKGGNVRSMIKEVNGRPPEYYEYSGKRNKRSVWFISTQPYPDAHFAVMPPELAEVCIMAGTPEVGCCRLCATPWERVLGPKQRVEGRGSGNGFKRSERLSYQDDNGPRGDDTPWVPTDRPTVGWAMSCDCPIGTPIPATVLDPFSGAGTTALVADRLGRDAIGMDLNPAYDEMARKRLVKDAGLFAEFG